MMLHRIHRAAALAVALAALPAPLAAQTAPDHPWSAAFAAGLTTTSPGSGGALGAVMTLDINDRFGVEVGGDWLDRGRGGDNVVLGGSVLVNLLPRASKAVPFAAAGVSIVRARFDMDDDRFLGGMFGQFGPGATMVPVQGRPFGGMMSGPYTGPAHWSGTWTGPTADLSNMPMFYQQRMGAVQMRSDGRWGMQSFTDPALSLGGGVRFNVTERVYVRPDARALIVLADGDQHTIGRFTVGVGLTF